MIDREPTIQMGSKTVIGHYAAALHLGGLKFAASYIMEDGLYISRDQQGADARYFTHKQVEDALGNLGMTNTLGSEHWIELFSRIALFSDDDKAVLRAWMVHQ